MAPVSPTPPRPLRSPQPPTPEICSRPSLAERSTQTTPETRLGTRARLACSYRLGARHEPLSSSFSSSSIPETQPPAHASAHAPRPLQIQTNTQRSSSLYATKLECINQYHLMLKWRSSEEGVREKEELKKVAEWINDLIKERFPMTSTLTAVHAFLQLKPLSPEAWNEYISQTHGEIHEQLHGGVRKELGGPGLVDAIQALGAEVMPERFLDARGSQL
ncbi:hypothetical protein K435DRAFT_866554 [Dendrothele bispora CBS 962.96]|uniref:Uncharacterized protein n=1 Tax=Dendrothele bispora (strain CBS 962.96) TaxID=1314807 RepID=A0A4S8LH94_DENBC|nr:hypothetical protein K435DRAFT_866554 [Dendrothele bispora CBS 962.96]